MNDTPQALPPVYYPPRATEDARRAAQALADDPYLARSMDRIQAITSRAQPIRDFTPKFLAGWCAGLAVLAIVLVHVFLRVEEGEWVFLLPW